MFTANSMNCLTEAIGLALPGNGSVLATHTARKALYEDAGRTVVDITKRYYEQDDETVLPRNIATRAAFENAMALDIAMGGSTNTILHLLAAAQEAGVDFGLDDIDEVSRRVPVPGQGRAERRHGRHVLHGGRAPGRRHPRHPRRAAPRRACSTRTCTRSTRPSLDGLAEDLGRPRRLPVRGGRRAVARGPRLRPLRRGLLPVRALGDARHWTPRAAASATSSTRTPRTAAWRSSTATSPSTAAS